MTKSVSKINRPVRSAANATPKDAAKPSSKPRERPAKAKADQAPANPIAQGASSKQAQLAALLVRDEGATLDQMIALTGWLPHTTRAALTGLRKKGYVIDSDKLDGVRTYRAVAPE
jgi:hypothetical protein